VVAVSVKTSSARGVDGDESDNSAAGAGAAYVFDLDAPYIGACTWYCGTGVNAATDGFSITGSPVLGGTFSASITACAPGNAGAILVAYASSITVLSNWGEFLVNFTDPGGELLGMPAAFGSPALIDIAVPSDPFFAGFVFYTQAAGFGGTTCLHCAHECTVGQ